MFDRDAIPAAAQLRRYGVSLIAIIAVTTIGILERIVGTGSLTGRQWGICVAIAASLLVVEEVLKLVLRNRSRTTSPTALTPVAGVTRTRGTSVVRPPQSKSDSWVQSFSAGSRMVIPRVSSPGRLWSMTMTRPRARVMPVRPSGLWRGELPNALMRAAG